MKRENKYRVWNESFTEFHVNTLTELIGAMYYDDAVKSTFEQFTGLTDTDGVEIYEGDILLAYWRCEPKNYKVYCDPDTQSWDIVSTDSDGNIQGLYDYHFNCQVIGNIHQDKELIS